jgi:hypothetical protein
MVIGCVAVPAEFWALTCTVTTAGLVGVPLIVAVPGPVAAKLRPRGRVPVRVSEGGGYPVAATMKELASPTVKVTAAELEKPGAATTVSVKFWMTAAPTPLSAVIVIA